MDSAYDMLSALARYLFIALILYIIALSLVLSIKEARIMRHARRLEKMNIRYIRFTEPESAHGLVHYINGECSIGGSEGDDVFIENGGLERAHIKLFDNKGFVYIKVKRKRFFTINGLAQRSRTVMLEPGDRVRVTDTEFICAPSRSGEAEDAEV